MKVVAIVPAYNEEQTVGAVVSALLDSGIPSEVIVVSDGSEDDTCGAARERGARVIDLPDNNGKGAALKSGMEGCEADVYLFVDADLVGFEPTHVRLLVDPVLRGQCEMTLGLFGGGRLMTDLAHAMAPYLSGQRAVSSRVIRKVPGMEVTRYGVELALTRYAKKWRLPVQRVKLPDLTHRMKEEKMGFWAGLRARLQMYWEIAMYLQRGGRN